jgi:hypothetical protein
MKSSASFLAALLPALLALRAEAATFTYDLSGEQFVQWMSHPEPLSELDYRNREKAYSYLDGVKDATVGNLWCPAKPRKTFELAYDAADYIKGLPPQARNGNAAKLLLSFLSSRYPCTKGVRQ